MMFVFRRISKLLPLCHFRKPLCVCAAFYRLFTFFPLVLFICVFLLIFDKMLSNTVAYLVLLPIHLRKDGGVVISLVR